MQSDAPIALSRTVVLATGMTMRLGYRCIASPREDLMVAGPGDDTAQGEPSPISPIIDRVQDQTER